MPIRDLLTKPSIVLGVGVGVGLGIGSMALNLNHIEYSAGWQVINLNLVECRVKYLIRYPILELVQVGGQIGCERAGSSQQ